MKDLRLEERFIIETEEQGVHTFEVYIEHENTTYYIEGMATVSHQEFNISDETRAYKDYSINFQIDIDEVYSGIDCEDSHTDKSLLESLKMALYAKLRTL
tara:strand:- start:743 stop:1042 length:300 start_codon:yes stop_codon:yes gene_type:complete